MPEATVTLYRITGLDWQVVDTITTGTDGQFTVDYAELSDPAWFLIFIQYPDGYVPASAQAGPNLEVVSDQMLMGVEPLVPGVYGDNHFFSLQLPDATPGPETPTPPPLPTIPWPTLTPTP